MCVSVASIPMHELGADTGKVAGTQVNLALLSQHLVGPLEGPLSGIWDAASGSWLGCCLLLLVLELRLLLLVLLRVRMLLLLRLLLTLRLLHWLLQLCWRSHSMSILLLRLWGRCSILLLRWPHLLCG